MDVNLEPIIHREPQWEDTMRAARKWLYVAEVIGELADRARESGVSYATITAPLRDRTGDLIPWAEAEAGRRLELAELEKGRPQ